jgi:signal peptidase I
VIGLPGDQISVERGSLAINGKPIPQCDVGPYANLVGPLSARGRLTVEFLDDNTYLTVRKPVESAMNPYTVQPGEVFVVGDDRGMSSDSRVWNEGHGAGIPVEVLQGRVSRVLVGEHADGQLDFSRLLTPLRDLKVRLTGVDMRKTEERIQKCLDLRAQITAPPVSQDVPMSY